MPIEESIFQGSSPRWLNKLLLPCNCVICETQLFNSISLCSYCKNRLPWLLKQCAACAIPMIKETQQNLCGRCLIDPPVFDSCNAVFTYEVPISKLVARFKYRANFAHLSAPRTSVELSKEAQDEFNIIQHDN